MPGRTLIWRWFPIINLWPASRISIDIAKYCYTASNMLETVLQKNWYFTEAILLFVRI